VLVTKGQVLLRAVNGSVLWRPLPLLSEGKIPERLDLKRTFALPYPRSPGLVPRSHFSCLLIDSLVSLRGPFESILNRERGFTDRRNVPVHFPLETMEWAVQ